MDILIRAGQLLLSLSILIVLHEMGHFLAARFFKTRVEKFYLFFNPWFSLFKWRKGDTEYGLGWLPLGGYVKISGMIDESMDKEAMKQPPQPWEFRSKPAWQRLIIMLGGIIMNVLLGIFIYWMVFSWYGESYFRTADLKYGIMVDSVGEQMGFQNGDKIIAVDGKPADVFSKINLSIILDRARTVTVNRNGQNVDLHLNDAMIKTVLDSKAIDFMSIRIPFVADSVEQDSAAAKAGIQKGDMLIAINGEQTIFFDQVRKQLDANKGKTIEVALLRNHKVVHTNVSLGASGILGIYTKGPADFYNITDVKYNLLQALPASISRAAEIIRIQVEQFKLIFSPTIQGYKHVGGFITVASGFSAVWVWEDFWKFTAFLSLVLAFMNLLPIPALDGGHVVFTLIEMITRRKPNEKFLEYAQVVGMALLFALLIFANGNDIIGLFK